MVVDALWHSCEVMDAGTFPWFKRWYLWFSHWIGLPCFMICPIARVVWKRMLRMLYSIYGKQVYTWGFVTWGRLAQEIQNYEKEYVDFLLLSVGRHVLEVSYTTRIHCLKEDKVWSTISSLVVWVLWKARCKNAFQKVKHNAVELVK